MNRSSKVKILARGDRLIICIFKSTSSHVVLYCTNENYNNIIQPLKRSSKVFICIRAKRTWLAWTDGSPNPLAVSVIRHCKNNEKETMQCSLCGSQEFTCSEASGYFQIPRKTMKRRGYNPTGRITNLCYPCEYREQAIELRNLRIQLLEELEQIKYEYAPNRN
jgi:hypothetical protein